MQARLRTSLPLTTWFARQCPSSEEAEVMCNQFITDIIKISYFDLYLTSWDGKRVWRGSGILKSRNTSCVYSTLPAGSIVCHVPIRDLSFGQASALKQTYLC